MYKGRHTIWVIFFVFIFLLVVGSFNTTADSQRQKTLTNDDIVSLVKAGLSDEAITSMIQKSQTQFDLSPNALIELKKVGVSNKVIEAMIGGSRPSSAGDSENILIPTAYGYYVVDEGQLRKIESTPVVTKIGLRPGGPRSRNPGSAMDGFAGEPSLNIKSQTPIFIVYQQNVDPNDFHLADLVYVSTKQAGQFNYFGTNPMFFRNVYGGVDESDIIRIDLWRPKSEILLSIEPVEGKTGMYRLIPRSSLKHDSRYALYYKNDVHKDGTIFIARDGKQRSAFYFKIGE